MFTYIMQVLMSLMMLSMVLVMITMARSSGERISEMCIRDRLHTVSRGWWLFAAMTGLFYITLSVMAGIPTNLRLRPEDMPAAVMVLALLPLTYATIFTVLYQQDKLFRVREHQRAFAIQTAMMLSLIHI